MPHTTGSMWVYTCAPELLASGMAMSTASGLDRCGHRAVDGGSAASVETTAEEAFNVEPMPGAPFCPRVHSLGRDVWKVGSPDPVFICQL